MVDALPIDANEKKWIKEQSQSENEKTKAIPYVVYNSMFMSEFAEGFALFEQGTFLFRRATNTPATVDCIHEM